MSTEREVKLSAPPTFRMPWLDGIADGVSALPRETERLKTTYVDTDDYRLARWGVSLRHRAGQGWTTKLPAETSGPLLVRGEYTVPGDEGVPPLESVDLVRAYVRTAELRPVARLRTVRRHVELRDFQDRLFADVVDDEVSVLSGRRIAARFRELEVEIPDEIAQEVPDGLLEGLIARLRAAGAGEPDTTSKYVRAVGALATRSPEVVAPSLPSGSSAGVVVRRAIGASVIHVLRHDVVVRLDSNPEGVHQARVATRRLRSDLRTFSSLLEAEWTRSLREELRWLGVVLGDARDADVMLERVRSRAASIPVTEAPGAARVLDALDRRRKEAHAVVIETLRGDRYVELLDRLVAAANEPDLLLGADLPAVQVLPGLVRGPWRALRRYVRTAGSSPTDEQLHMIRIRTKRVRYAADAVAPLMGRPARRFADEAAALQTVLGEHNDAVVAEAWLRTWAASERSGDASFAAGMLAGIERAGAQTARERWRRRWKRLAARDLRGWM